MNCWKQRTCLEKKTLIIFVVLLLILTILITLIMVFSEPNYCQSPSCITFSKHILQQLDFSEKPCQNFYKFSCGSFGNKQTAFKSVLDEERRKNELKLQELVLRADEWHYSKSLKLQKLYYHSCMDLQAIDANRDGPWLDIVKKLGGWPVVIGNNWNESAFDLIEMMVNLREVGLPHEWFFNVSVNLNMENAGIEINVPDNDENILETQQQLLYTDLMKNIAVYYGAHDYVARTEMKEVLYFELKLQKLFSEMKNDDRMMISIEEVQNQWQKINWFELLKQLTRAKLTERNLVGFAVGNYLPKLDKMLKETRKRTQVNYIMWKLTVHFAPFLSIRNQIINYHQQTNRSNTLKWYLNREEFCYAQTKSNFPFALESNYLRLYVPQRKRDQIEEMLEMIRNQMGQHLIHANWMDEKTRKTALTKLKNVSFIIGGPEEMYYIQQFDKYIGSELIADESTRNIIDFQCAINSKNAQLKFDIDKWKNLQKHKLYELVPTLRAQFLREYNLLYIPAGLLQDIFYDESRPNYINYATLGAIIGHELSHGFDSGTFGTTTWWSNATHNNFQTVARCLADRNNDEIAYLAGINLAYEAYQKWLQINPAELGLPGILFQPSQIYWLAHTSLICHNDEDAEDEHFLHSKRMMMAYQNSAYFSRDFECALNSHMNPKIKCQIL